MKSGSKTETAVNGVLMAAFTVVSPFVAQAAGRWAYATLSRIAQVQRAALRRVPATLLQSVDQAGDLADPPMQQAEIADRTELAQGSAAALFAIGLAVIGRQAHRSLDRRRMAA
jgi:hypothetical protein